MTDQSAERTKQLQWSVGTVWSAFMILHVVIILPVAGAFLTAYGTISNYTSITAPDHTLFLGVLCLGMASIAWLARYPEQYRRKL